MQANGRSHRKFLYDVRAKDPVREIDCDVLALHRIFGQGNTAVLVGSNRRSLVVVEYDPDRKPAFTILKGDKAERWARQANPTPGDMSTPSKAHKKVRFGSEHQFALIDAAGKKEIVERSGKVYRVLQSTFDAFAKARAARVGDSYSRQHPEIEEEIGAWQLAQRELRIAKIFYDGEGHTGVGGFGRFDTNTRSYKLFSPPEVAAWSVPAMLVEADAVWLALASCGEWGDYRRWTVAIRPRNKKPASLLFRM